MTFQGKHPRSQNGIGNGIGAFFGWLLKHNLPAGFSIRCKDIFNEMGCNENDHKEYANLTVFLDKSYTVMEVSWNRGTPKSSILKGCSIINHPFWGTPFMEPPLLIITIEVRSPLFLGDLWQWILTYPHHRRAECSRRVWICPSTSPRWQFVFLGRPRLEQPT